MSSRIPDAIAATPRQADPSLWKGLAQAADVEEHCRSWLGIQCSLIPSVQRGLVELVEDLSGWRRAAEWPEEGGEIPALESAARRAAREGRGVVTSAGEGEPGATGEAEASLLAYPVRVHGAVRAVAALALAPRSQDGLRLAMRQLQWGVAWLQNWFLREPGQAQPDAARRLAAALDLIAVATEEERFQAAATAFVTELATRLQCDRVSVGFLERRQVRVRALSHSAQFTRQMNLVRAIGGAMGESMDQQEILVFPPPEAGPGSVLKAHEQLARGQGDQAICTAPFVDSSGRAFGALTLERSAASPFSAEAVALVDSVAAVAGAILDEKRRNDRLLPVKAAHSLWTQITRLLGPRHVVRKLVAAGLLAATLFFWLATGTFRVTAATALEGEVQRVAAAPFRGFVAEAPVRSGDLVKQGQLMARLDDRDLRVEFSRASSEREQYLLEQRRARAEGDVASMNVLAKKMQQAEAMLALLDEQLQRTRITAPFDGLVVSGDLSQSLGAPVDQGEVLFEVAPLDSYRVTLKVPESDIQHIEPGQSGELILTALPGTRLGFEITTITPVSQSEEGRNLFMVEARLVDASPRLRPGMEGYGKIEIGTRPLIWIWTHGLTDWLRLRLWSWTP